MSSSIALLTTNNNKSTTQPHAQPHTMNTKREVITKEEAAILKRKTGFDGVQRSGKYKVNVQAFDHATEQVEKLLNENGYNLIKTVSGQFGNNDLLMHVASKKAKAADIESTDWIRKQLGASLLPF